MRSLRNCLCSRGCEGMAAWHFQFVCLNDLAVYCTILAPSPLVGCSGAPDYAFGLPMWLACQLSLMVQYHGCLPTCQPLAHNTWFHSTKSNRDGQILKSRGTVGRRFPLAKERTWGRTFSCSDVSPDALRSFLGYFLCGFSRKRAS